MRRRGGSAAAAVIVAAALGAGVSAGGAFAGTGTPTASAVPTARSQASPVPPGAVTSSDQAQVVLSGTVSVPRGTSVGEVVVFRGRATVAGVVVGDVVVASGPIMVSGQVSGDVVALAGPVRILGSAQIGGSVLGGGAVVVLPGAKIAGSTRQQVRFTLSGWLGALGALVSWLMMVVSTLLLGLLLLAITPRGADRVADAGRSAPVIASVWGLALAATVPLVGLSLTLSIAGLPLGLTGLLSLGALFLLGYTWAIWIVGRLLVAPPRSRLIAFLAGWGVAAVVGIIPGVNGIVGVLASMFGLGAAAVAIWRARGSNGRHRKGMTPVSDPASRAPEPIA